MLVEITLDNDVNKKTFLFDVQKLEIKMAVNRTDFYYTNSYNEKKVISFNESFIDVEITNF